MCGMVFLVFIVVVIPFPHPDHIPCVTVVRRGYHSDIDRKSIHKGNVRILTHPTMKDWR